MINGKTIAPKILRRDSFGHVVDKTKTFRAKASCYIEPYETFLPRVIWTVPEWGLLNPRSLNFSFAIILILHKQQCSLRGETMQHRRISSALQWPHNGHDGVSNHQPHHYLLNRVFRRRSKKTSKLRVTGLCAGNSPMTGEFPAQMARNAENVSIWWCHHGSVQLAGPRIGVD